MMVRGSAATGGGTGCDAEVDASSPARKPASQTRWVGVAVPTTRLRSSISSSAKGAVLGIGERGIGCHRSARAGRPILLDIECSSLRATSQSMKEEYTTHWGVD